MSNGQPENMPSRIFMVHRRYKESLVVERDNIDFVDGWVVFSNGPRHSEKTDVKAFPETSGIIEVEEITPSLKSVSEPAPPSNKVGP